MGSLIPLIGQIPMKLFNLSAITSESITHYTILLLGFLSFSYFLKSPILKIIFSIIWFFPPMRLIDITQFSFGIHYSLIAIACYLFDVYNKLKGQYKQLLQHSILSIIVIILISAIWVSDMAIVSVFLMLTIQSFFYLKKNKGLFSFFKKIEFYYTLAGVVLGYIFIQYAKNTAANKQDYTVFSDLNTILQACSIFWSTILIFFTFKANEPFTSIYAYLVSIVFIIIIVQIKNLNCNEVAKKTLLFFLFDAIVLFCIILISNWTYLNGVPRRYFTCTYVSLSFSLLLILDNLHILDKYKNTVNGFLLITVFIGGIGTLYNIKFIWPKTLIPKVELASEFNQLGKIGIISDYWNSYINSCSNPDMIKATPHDTTWAVRNYEMVDEVFKQKKIML